MCMVFTHQPHSQLLEYLNITVLLLDLDISMDLWHISYQPGGEKSEKHNS